jgi:hypothetical protein
MDNFDGVLRQGDCVKNDMDDATYHRVAQAFLKAGSPALEYDRHRRAWEDKSFFGWIEIEGGGLWHGDKEAFTRQLTVDQVLSTLAPKSIDIERLKTDRAYWDEVAPEWADGAWQCAPASVYWYKVSERLYCPSRHGDLIFAQGLDSRMASRKWINQPKPTQWRGPQDGLPPVGTECESKLCGAPWERGFLRYVGKNLIVWESISGHEYATRPLDRAFRPIQNEREKAIEAARSVDGALTDSGGLHTAALALIDAGWRPRGESDDE